MNIQPPRSGRIVRIADTTLDLLSEGRTTTIQIPGQMGHPDLRIGDLVTLQLTSETPPSLEKIIETHPWRGPGDFPPGDSDWARMNAGENNLITALDERARLLRGVRAMLDSRGFLEVETPSLAACASLEPHLESVRAKLRMAPGQDEETRWLVTSPEYHMKRLLSAGASRIYQIGKAFRSGETGRHHNPEFTMLEWYRAFEDVEQGILDAVDVVCTAARTIRGTLAIPYQGTMIDLSPPWPRWTVRAAILEWAGFDPDPSLSLEALRERATHAGIGLDAEDRERADILIRTLVERVEPAIPRDRPVILHDYPRCLASLARCKPGAPEIAERFEIYIGGMEIANGFGELVDAEEQRLRFQAEAAQRAQRDLPSHPMDRRLIAALEAGLPPSTGVALGVDRLLMMVTDRPTINDVLAFPAGQT